jgi:hypothetical protein
MSSRRIPGRFGPIVLACVIGAGMLVGVPAAAHGASGAAAYPRPVAQVHVDGQAYEGARGTILAGLRARCAPGYRVEELVLQFSQGEVTTPPQLGQPFPCDGRWHRQRPSSLEAFGPGRAVLTARLTVVRTSTGTPAPPAVDTRSIYVRPAAKVVLPRTAHLAADGSLSFVVRARCDQPWVLQEFLVAATQGEFPDVASGSALLDLPCDGVVHRVPVRLAPTDPAFARGPLRVDAALTLLDPESFDPVTQATATRTVRVR